MKIEIRGDNVTVPAHMRQVIEKRARLALGRLVAQLTDVRIVIRDLNGPKHGVDIECTVAVRTRRGDEIRAEATDVMVQRASGRAIERAARGAHRLIARLQRFARDTVRTPTPEPAA